LKKEKDELVGKREKWAGVEYSPGGGDKGDSALLPNERKPSGNDV